MVLRFITGSDHKPLPISSTPDLTIHFNHLTMVSYQMLIEEKLDIGVVNNSNFSLTSPSRTPLFGVGEFLGLVTNDFR